jgi:hypothetical protein
MARLLAVDDAEISADLREALLKRLRSCDEARILPSAYLSKDSGAFKNVVMHLSGEESGLCGSTFSCNWFSGVSIVEVPRSVALRLLNDPTERAKALLRLRDAIPNELSDEGIEVGPSLDGDSTDCDQGPWTAGFDGPGCCVGLYSAQQSKSPAEGVESGMNRNHDVYYLVAKAGGGIAAQTFHARLCSELAKGKTLDKALGEGGIPGPNALRRVEVAAQRNRGRILLAAAEAIGFHEIDTLSDQACGEAAPHRLAVPRAESFCNVLSRVEGTEGNDGTVSSVWKYSSGCIDARRSTGIVISSNPQDGFCLFAKRNGDMSVTPIENELYDTIPFASVRLKSNRDVVLSAAEAHRKVKGTDAAAHPDHAWIRERFAWRSKPSSKGVHVDVEPECLWGSFDSERWIASHARITGVSGLCAAKLMPEMVVLPGMETSKLRAVARRVHGE